MSYSSDKTAYNNGINNDISTQTAPNSIPPEVVGAGYTDLADLLEPYINSINNQALLFGPGVPSNALGADLDLYFRQSNPIEIYRKVSGVWVLQGTLPLGFTLPEGNLTVRTSIEGFVVTATKGGWVIANTVYQKNTQTQLLVDPADLNLGRIDNVYANTSNNILYQVGTASATPAAPTLPANTILIDQVIVPASSSGDDPYLLFGGGSPSDGGTDFGNSTGLITGGVLTINADPTKFDVSAGTGLFVDYTSPIPPAAPSIINFGPLSGLTVTNIGSAIATYVGIDGDANIIQQITPFTPTQRRSIATLGILIHSNLTTINAINTQGSNILSPANQLHDFIEAIGPLNLSGNKYSNASTNLTIQKTAGSIFKFGCNSGDYTNPHQLNLSAGNPVTFRYRTRNGVETADTTNIIPGSYDNAGTITAVGSNQWTNQHITVFQSGLTRLQYGQNLYGSSAEALAASLTEPFAVEANIAANGIFRAILTIRGAATNLSITTDAIFTEVPKFGGSVGNAGSALTAANIIAALGYTPVDGPASSTDNAIARYDGITGNIIQDSAVQVLDTGDVVTTTTGGFKLHTGTTAQRPSPLLDGYFRKNNTFSPSALEYYDLATTTWRTLLDSTNLTVNAVLNQNASVQTASFFVSGASKVGGSTTPVQQFEVAGTNAAPNTSGSAANGAIRILAAGITSTVLDSGVDGTNSFAWIQARSSTDYSIPRQLRLNFNGGSIFFGTSLTGPNVNASTQFGHFNSSNIPRWFTQLFNTETGSNNGSDWRLVGIQDDGSTPAGTWITIKRSNGLFTITGNTLIGTTTDSGFKLDVVGTSRFTGSNAAPASSGSAVSSSMRLEASGNSGTVLRGGVDATNSYSWLQSSSGTDFSVQRELRLNPNGGSVTVGAVNSLSNQSIAVSTGLTTAGSTVNYFFNHNAPAASNRQMAFSLRNTTGGGGGTATFTLDHVNYDGAAGTYSIIGATLDGLNSSSHINSLTTLNFKTGSGTGTTRAHITSTGLFFLDTTPAQASSTALLLYRETSGEVRQGALILPIRTITATTTIAITDYTILVDATSGNVTVNLPTASSASGVIFNVKRIVTASNTITIDPSGAELIDGASTFNVPTLNQSVMFQSNGTAWFTL